VQLDGRVHVGIDVDSEAVSHRVALFVCRGSRQISCLMARRLYAFLALAAESTPYKDSRMRAVGTTRLTHLETPPVQ
jgi:hypothetical protein